MADPVELDQLHISKALQIVAGAKTSAREHLLLPRRIHILETRVAVVLGNHAARPPKKADLRAGQDRP
jgi:hypothetical protein